jgi:hypothetical protein
MIYVGLNADERSLAKVNEHQKSAQPALVYQKQNNKKLCQAFFKWLARVSRQS